MPRLLLIGLLVIGLLLGGCAATRDAQMADGSPCSQDKPRSSWCREHPLLTGALAGMFVVGAVMTAGYFAL